MTTVAEFNESIRIRLQDVDEGAYTLEDILNAINLGGKAIVSLRPDANPVVTTMQMAAGHKQAVPSDLRPHRVLDILCNMGANGATPGDSVFLVERGAKDAEDRSWRSAAQVAAIDEWMLDDRNPTGFLVSPPSNGTGYLEILISQIPATVADDDDTIGLLESYIPALEEYVLYYLWGGDRETSPNHGRAMGAYQRFLELLGVKLQAEEVASPKTEAQLA